MKKNMLLLLLVIAGMGVLGFLPSLLEWTKPRTPLSEEGFREGDILFQHSNSAQSMAIQLATHSSYTHCGLLFKEGTEWWVFEAVQPVGRCKLSDWIRRGKEQRFVVKRLKNAETVLSKTVLDSMRSLGTAWKGMDYDPLFHWSDETLYCSELVWKLYARSSGLRLGEPETLRSLDLSAPQVQEIMYRRYGDQVPLDDSVITPVRIFKSPLLKTVYANGKWL